MKTKQELYMKILQSPERFTPLEDGWVRDIALGLDWGPSSTKDMDFAEAERYAAELGGRLPEAHELHALVDFSKEQPAINTEFFKDTKSNWYWTNTKTAWSARARWCVSFHGGYVLDVFEVFDYYVRPCRASQ